MQREKSLTRFWFIMQLFIAAYLLVVLADNFLLLFIGWEIVGLCITFLTSFDYKNKNKAHLGLKVNTILRVGDIALLIFILSVYAYSGTFNFVELSTNNSWIIRLSRDGLLLFSSFMLFGGVIGKGAQFPLHEWLPDMLVGTPSSSNALTETLAGPFLLARVLPFFHNAYISGCNELVYFFLTVAWIGAITGVIAALTATVQRHAQRVMAYSVSSIIGYMLTAFGLAGLATEMASGYLAGIAFLTIDAFVSALLILTTVLVSYAVKSEQLFNMSGFKNKLAHHGMEVAVFAMINVPPFSGFWLCNWVQSLSLNLAVENGQMFLIHSYGLFTLLIVGGGVTAFYGLKLMGLLFTKHSSAKATTDIPRSMRISYTSLLILTMVLDLAVPFFIPLLNTFFLPLIHHFSFQNTLDFLIFILPSMSTVVTLVALICGSYISHQIYVKHKVDPAAIIRKYPYIKKIYAFFLNRCYIDLLYHNIAHYAIVFSKKLFENVETKGVNRPRIRGLTQFFDLSVKWISSISRWGYPSIELRVFEGINRKIGAIIGKMSRWGYPSIELKVFEGINQKIVNTVTRLSEQLRSIQTGVLSWNMLVLLIGTLLLAVFLFAFGGLLSP
jgi:NADH-quinone oxidoreductase subunit L